MPEDLIELTFLPAADDPAPDSREYQGMLWAANDSLRERDVKFSSRAFAYDNDHAPLIHLGQVTLTTLGPPVIAAVAAVAGAWVQARFGRKVRLKVGDLEAEARTPEEVERLLKLAVEVRDGKPKASDGL